MKIKSGGEAKDRQFVRRDPKRSDASAQDEVLRQNRDAFTRMAKLNPEEHDSRMLAKVTGGLDHGGKNVLKSDSTGYRILAEFVRRMNSTTSASCECSRRNKSNAKSPPKSWNLAATASTRASSNAR